MRRALLPEQRGHALLDASRPGESVAALEQALALLPNVADDELARFGLAGREREVLALVAADHANAAIARALFTSVTTASVHVSSVMAKLGVSRRAEAGAIAHRLGASGRARA